jgi:RND family efflux transporter MFP subunit
MKSSLKILLAIALFVGGGFLAIRYFSMPEVFLAPAATETAVHAIPGNLRVQPTEWSVRLQTNGTVESIDAVVGDKVMEGQLLMHLDTTDIDIDLDLARIALDVAKKKQEIPKQNELALEVEKMNLERLQGALKRGVASETDIQRQEKLIHNYSELARLEELGLELAKAQAESQLARLGKNKERSDLKAPVAGTITHAWLLKGSYALHNTEAFRIQADDKVIEVKISEDDYPGIRKDLPARARLYSYGDQIFEGKVTQILPTADPDTQEYTIFLELDMQGKSLISGMGGEASIILGEAEGATVVPRRALAVDSVWVVENGTARKQPVKVGYRGLNKVQILEGLQPGQKVVLENQGILQEGMRVRVAE